LRIAASIAAVDGDEGCNLRNHPPPVGHPVVASFRRRAQSVSLFFGRKIGMCMFYGLKKSQESTAPIENNRFLYDDVIGTPFA
jgi:hypothetical protein